MSALMAILIWAILIVLFVIVVGELKFRYEKKNINEEPKDTISTDCTHQSDDKNEHHKRGHN